MGLIINQGKQDTSKDNTFEIIVSSEELAQITKVELDENWADTLKITFKIIGQSKYTNRLVFDRVSYTGDYSWKYRSLRRAAGVPYTESESPNVDVEALLLNKAVKLDLGIRKGNDGKDYQSVKYKSAGTSTVQTTTVYTEDIASEEDNIEISADEDLPW